MNSGGSGARSCREVARLMQRHLDDDSELDDLTRRRIEAHLEICRECGLEIEVYRMIKQALRTRRRRPDPSAIVRLTAFVDLLENADEADQDEAGRDSR